MNRRARPTKLPVASATTSPPTSPAARCAGPASSSASSSSSTSPTSRGAGTNPDFVRGDAVRATSTHSLSRVPVAILYIVANLALGIHLFHGAWSLFQSLGWNNPRFNRWRRELRRRLRRGDRRRQRLVPDRGAGRRRSIRSAAYRRRPTRRPMDDHARRQDPRRADRPRSGTSTSST